MYIDKDGFFILSLPYVFGVHVEDTKEVSNFHMFLAPDILTHTHIQRKYSYTYSHNVYNMPWLF